MDKTKAMRILDQKKIPYLTQEYPHDGDLCVIGTDVARLLNQDPNKVFKTLVTVGASKNHYVFVIPVAKQLDLKKAAKFVCEKNIAQGTPLYLAYNGFLVFFLYVGMSFLPPIPRAQAGTAIELAGLLTSSTLAHLPDTLTRACQWHCFRQP